ncbi:hypothetical protein HRbin23_01199 [bacterium HR23]|nr:hypothetical protein HRbin23_01199 [bacterium HR23]
MKSSAIPFRLERRPDGQWEAHCPSLGVSASAPSQAEALARLRLLIERSLPRLAEEDEQEDLIPWWRA